MIPLNPIDVTTAEIELLIRLLLVILIVAVGNTAIPRTDIIKNSSAEITVIVIVL